MKLQSHPTPFGTSVPNLLPHQDRPVVFGATQRLIPLLQNSRMSDYPDEARYSQLALEFIADSKKSSFCKIQATEIHSIGQQFEALIHRLSGFKASKFFETSFFQRKLLKVGELLKDPTVSLHDLNKMVLSLGAAMGAERWRPSGKRVLEDIHRLVGMRQFLETLSRQPNLVADGIGRTAIYHVSPEELEQALYKKGWGSPPIADVVILGGGPAGIASAYHLGRMGLRTVLFEAGNLVQAFSDANALSVKEMRTNARLSSLGLEGLVPDSTLDDLSMPRVMQKLNGRSMGRLGRQDVIDLTGKKLFDNPFPPLERGVSEPEFNPGVPVARNELFQYLDYVADQAAKFDSVVLSEQTKVVGINVYEETRKGRKALNHVKEAVNPYKLIYEVVTNAGHRQLTRKLIVSTGFVGTECQFSKMLPQLGDLMVQEQKNASSQSSPGNYPRNYMIAKTEKDLKELAPILADTLENLNQTYNNFLSSQEPDRSSTPIRQLIISETLLGKYDVQQYLSSLPAGSRVGVVGSGESSAKGALEVLSQNPSLKVDLFVSDSLKPSQAQIPPQNTQPSVILKGLQDPSFGEKTIHDWQKRFKTPITPRTFLNLMKGVRGGQIRIFELGRHFSSDTLRLNLVEKKDPISGQLKTVTQVWVQDPNILKNLEEQKKTYEQFGLLMALPKAQEGSGILISEIDGALISAIGYDRGALRQEPLAKILKDKGLLAFETKGKNLEIKLSRKDHLTSASDKNIGVAGTVNIQTASDSALFGIGARAYFLVNQLVHQFKSQKNSTISPEDFERYRHLSNPELLKTFQFQHTAPPIVTMVERLLQRQSTGEVLSPDELFLLYRFQELQGRMAQG